MTKTRHEYLLSSCDVEGQKVVHGGGGDTVVDSCAWLLVMFHD